MARFVKRRVLPVAALALLMLIPAAAADEPVRLYTNVDLLEFGPPPDPQDAPDAAAWDAELGWEFVTDFIERERSRLDRDRRDDLDRQLVEARVNELDGRAERAGIALPYYYGFGYYGHRSGRHGNGVGHKAKRSFSAGRVSSSGRSGLTGLHRPIVPLHARRPLAHGRSVGHGRRR